MSPEEFTNSRQDKKSKIKVPYEENIDMKPPAEVRKVGKPCTGVPSPEEMQKDREAALQATMNITGGKVSSPTEPKMIYLLEKLTKKVKRVYQQERLLVWKKHKLLPHLVITRQGNGIVKIVIRYIAGCYAHAQYVSRRDICTISVQIETRKKV